MLPILSPMDTVSRRAMRVVGYQVRTTNAEEKSPATSRLGPLWQRVMKPGTFDAVSRPVSRSRLVAVLHDYESNETGAYTEVIGVEVAPNDDETPAGMTSLLVPEAKSVKFTAHGQMPDAIMRTWVEIWDAFPSDDLSRSFSFDVELHPGDDAEATSSSPCTIVRYAAKEATGTCRTRAAPATNAPPRWSRT